MLSNQKDLFQLPHDESYLNCVYMSPLLRQKDFWIEDESYRTDHLFGFLLPKKIKTNYLLEKLQERKIYVSLRGDAIRVSPHVYNTTTDMEAVINILKTL